MQWVVRPDLLRFVHTEDDPVGEPVRAEIHDDREREREHETVLSADRLTDHEEYSAQKSQEQRRFERVLH